ncbi:cytochrome P450 [Marasmius fiardii PR-910]|nr:cytochrome P450 [Marasmius fiardii PR-910]
MPDDLLQGNVWTDSNWVNITLGFCALYVLFRVFVLIHWEYTSSIRHVAGPEATGGLVGFVMGNYKDLLEEENFELHRHWAETYGRNIELWGWLRTTGLWTWDCNVIIHVFKNEDDYGRLDTGTYRLSRAVGNGLLVTEGHKHRLHRRVMNPAFGTPEIRRLSEIFFQKSLKLRDLWWALLNENEAKTCQVEIEVVSWITRLTLNIIGEAGFHYSFSALDGKSTELSDAYSEISKASIEDPILLLKQAFPTLRSIIPEHNPAFRRARKIVSKIANQLLHESKTLNENGSDAKDLLSVLVKSNMGEGIPSTKRMTDEDVIAQVPTFLAAGYESTTVAMTTALLALMDHPDVQVRLRTELLGVSADTPSMDQLNELPYLDAFVKEVLRLYPPVPVTSRTALKDDVIPLWGESYRTIKVKKGTNIAMSIVSVNRDKELWGEDAEDFRPERWSRNLPDAVPGIWGNTMTFFGGPYGCIGWRFAVIEIKVFLFTVVRAFSLELGIAREGIHFKWAGVTKRPVIATTGLNQLPLVVRATGREGL